MSLCSPPSVPPSLCLPRSLFLSLLVAGIQVGGQLAALWEANVKASHTLSEAKYQELLSGLSSTEGITIQQFEIDVLQTTSDFERFSGPRIALIRRLLHSYCTAPTAPAALLHSYCAYCTHTALLHYCTALQLPFTWTETGVRAGR
jgi:hypothetical protein